MLCCEAQQGTTVSSIVVSPRICCYMLVKLFRVSNSGNTISVVCCFRYHLSSSIGFLYHMCAPAPQSAFARSWMTASRRKVLDDMAGAGAATSEVTCCKCASRLGESMRQWVPGL
jgi:hypothetical protein